MKRFSLRSVLMLLTAVALTFGYLRWRRDRVLTAVEQLRGQGIEVAVEDHGWWAAVPQPVVRVRFYVSGRMLGMQNKLYDLPKAAQFVEWVDERVSGMLGAETAVSVDVLGQTSQADEQYVLEQWARIHRQ